MKLDTANIQIFLISNTKNKNFLHFSTEIQYICQIMTKIITILLLLASLSAHSQFTDSLTVRRLDKIELNLKKAGYHAETSAQLLFNSIGIGLIGSAVCLAANKPQYAYFTAIAGSGFAIIGVIQLGKAGKYLKRAGK
jgi:hypothetical protein